MEKVNVDYEFLKKYYHSDDIASIYGVDKYEIRHSNVLKWILEPKDDEAIDYLPIRNLLRIIQENKSLNNNNFNSVNLTTARLNDVTIEREKYDIDLLITLKVENNNYAIVIENKLESFIHDDQLDKYKKKVAEFYPKYEPLNVFLHPGINLSQEAEANNNQYVSITYQEVYDNILKSIAELTSNSTLKLIVYYYIHTLCCYETNNLFGLIITDEEATALNSLFNDTQIITMIDMLYDNKQDDNVYITFYRDNKTTFNKIFKKYLRMKNANASLVSKVEKILKDKSYILNGIPRNSIVEVLECMFDELLNKQHKSMADIQDLINIFSSSDPLLILKDDVKNTEHPRWYLANPKPTEYKGNQYYILSAWYSTEYDELKDRFSKLKVAKPDVYKDISLG